MSSMKQIMSIYQVDRKRKAVEIDGKLHVWLSRSAVPCPVDVFVAAEGSCVCPGQTGSDAACRACNSPCARRCKSHSLPSTL